MKKQKKARRSEKPKKSKASEWTGEEQSRVVGFFDLLLRIDMRNNPEKYQKNNA